MSITCSAEGCARPAKRRGWCDMHYRRFLRAGGKRERIRYPDRKPTVKDVTPASRMCTVEGCPDAVRGRGLCGKHWQRWKEHGDPTFIKTGRGLPTAERFWRFVRKTDSCWLWTGCTSRAYGMFQISRSIPRVYSHRFAYELLVGPIPEGLELDHLCNNPLCVNPAHLQPVTHAENCRRHWKTAKIRQPPILGIRSGPRLAPKMALHHGLA